MYVQRWCCCISNSEWQRIRFIEIPKYHINEQLMLSPLLGINNRNCFLQDILRVYCVRQRHTLNTTTLIKSDKLFLSCLTNPVKEFTLRSLLEIHLQPCFLDLKYFHTIAGLFNELWRAERLLVSDTELLLFTSLCHHPLGMRQF